MNAVYFNLNTFLISLRHVYFEKIEKLIENLCYVVIVKDIYLVAMGIELFKRLWK